MMTKEQEILNAAEEEFFRNGFDSSSTAVIAKRAGVTHAMVNYYFRTKEKLFIQILDNHVYELLEALKPVMHAEGGMVDTAVAAAEVFFDKMNVDRRLPFIITDISRTHPDFLLRYRDAFVTTCRESIGNHAQRLADHIAGGTVSECTMGDIYSTVLTLSTAPFLSLPLLENVAQMTPEQTDAYLQSRKEEMVKIIRARYCRQ